MPGANASGYADELRKLKVWVEDQIRAPERPLPAHFVTKTARLFASGFLEERRPQRVPLLQSIAQDHPSNEDLLRQLGKWIGDDLSDACLRKCGRPCNYQMIVFAAEIANLWNTLTGRPMAMGPDTNFARFLSACWESGSVERQLRVNFKRTLRHHIKEDPDPCGRCASCTNSENCERKRYYGILMYRVTEC